MSEQDNREQEHLNPELTDEQIYELLNQDTDEDAPEEDVNPDELKEKLSQKDSIIRQLHARIKKAEVKKQEPTIKKPESKDDDIRQTVETLKLAEEKRQFGYENNLSPEETDYLFKISPNPSKELLSDAFVKGGLDAIRAKKRDADNTPSLNSRSPRFELPKKENLSKDDKQQAFDEYKKNKFGK